MSLLIQTLGFGSFFGQVLEASLTFTTVLCNLGPAYRSPQAKQVCSEMLCVLFYRLQGEPGRQALQLETCNCCVAVNMR